MDAEQIGAWIRRLTREPLWEPSAEHRVQAGREVVERWLPHRAPFLLVDEVVAADPFGGRALARRTLDPADPVFAGHFPGSPVYPGVLLVEALGQTGLCALRLREDGLQPDPEREPPPVRVTRVHHAVFLAPLRPGETVELAAQILDDDPLMALVATQARRDQTLCAVALLEVYFA